MKLFKKLLLIICFSFLVVSCDEGNVSQTPSNEPSNTTVESTTPEESSTPEVSTTPEGSTTPEVSTTPEDSTTPQESSTPESSTTPEDSSSPEAEFVDYVAATKLDLNDTSKIYAEVKVHLYVDGDTTHFVPKGAVPENWVQTEKNILKARYNSCDTPESTGKVEPWGETAKQFTRNALENAHSIIIQSDNETWNTDSTADRYLVWVWYQPKENADYRLLNLELIQEGLAKLKSASSYSLYETFNAANMQAITNELKVYSSEKDPNYYYGLAQVITIKELRMNPEKYKNTKVCVNGVITLVDKTGHMAYAQAYDVDEEKWYGIDVYYGFNSYPIIKVGNYLRLVGTLGYYETGNSWQLTGLSYHRMDPDYEGSMKLLEKDYSFEPVDVTAADLSGRTDNTDYLEPGDLAMSIYAKISGLKVVDVYTTKSTVITSNGAMTLTCKDSNGTEVTVRTSVLKKSDGTLLAEADVLNKTIDATGIVTSYNGEVQIHVFTLNELTIA